MSLRPLADYYEEVVRLTGEPKTSSNWVMGELLRLLNEHGKDVKDSPVAPSGLAELIKLITSGKLSGKMAKDVFEEMFAGGKAAGEVVKAKGLTQISDDSTLARVIDDVVNSNPENLERYRAGKDKLFGFFVGEVMKATKGQANPAAVNRLLKERLGKNAS